MAILGIGLSRDNPEFTAEDFLIWMPQFSQYLATEEGQKMFEKMRNLANKKIFYNIYGSDWELAMSYCIAHYITLIAQQVQAPSGSQLGEIAGGGVTKGVLTGATIGGFSKSYDLQYTLVNAEKDPYSSFWNQTSYGQLLMSLLKTKAVPTIMVVTDGPLINPGIPTSRYRLNDLFGSDNYVPPVVEKEKLDVPFVTIDDTGLASWNKITNADQYIYSIDDGPEILSDDSRTIQLNDGESIRVKSISNNKFYSDSYWSTIKTYIANV